MTARAVNRGLAVVVVMTSEAPAHFHLLHRNAVFPVLVGDEVELVELLDRTVAGLALHPRLNVPVVAELHVFGQPVDLNPLDGPPLLPVLLENPDALDLVVGLGNWAWQPMQSSTEGTPAAGERSVPE